MSFEATLIHWENSQNSETMDMLAIHAQASASSIVAYNDFLLYYKQGKKMVYAFVEGRDDPSFYRGFIDSYLSSGWECKIIRPGNKKRVLEVFVGMDWSRFPREAICFFVDRDLSTFLGDEIPESSNLYISDNYSIENDVVNSYVFERIVEEVNGVTGLQPQEVESLRKLFESNLNVFIESVCCIMAQIVILRRKEADGDILIARLDKIKPLSYFHFKDGGLEIVPQFSNPKLRVQHAAMALGTSVAGDLELTTVETEFREAFGVEKFTRGKYLLKFFVECVENIRVSIPKLFPRFSTAPGSRSGMSPGNAMVYVGPRARCPSSLKAFLENNYGKFINGANVA